MLVLGFLGQEYFQRHDPGVEGGSPHLLVGDGGERKKGGRGREREGEEEERGRGGRGKGEGKQ